MEQIYTRRSTQHAQGKSNPYCEEEEYDDVWPTRMPSSVRRYQSDVKAEVGHIQPDVQTLNQQKRYSAPPQRRKAGMPARNTEPAAPLRAGRRNVNTEEIKRQPTRRSTRPQQPEKSSSVHWMVYVGIAMIVMVVAWMAFSAVASWWQVTQDDWHYGRPRTTHTDAVVGHNDSLQNPSHFIAINLNRHVQIIEFPGGQAEKARLYSGPVLAGQGQDLAVVRLEFKDVNHDNQPDMLVIIQDSRIVYINEKGTFRPARSDEQIQL